MPTITDVSDRPTRPARATINPPVDAFQVECHYCGYEAAGDERSQRCPKCGGSFWEYVPVPGSLLAFAMRQDPSARSPDHNPRCVRFSLRQPAAQVYLCGNFSEGRRKIVTMQEVRPGCWETRLMLPPGEYRYRFYVDDGKRLIYRPPTGVSGKPGEAMDATLVVTDHRPIEHPIDYAFEVALMS